MNATRREAIKALSTLAASIPLTGAQLLEISPESDIALVLKHPAHIAPEAHAMLSQTLTRAFGHLNVPLVLLPDDYELETVRIVDGRIRTNPH